MSLSASLWSSVSGLLVHGDKMNVIGNNIANVNTIGFKSQRMDFQDFIYQSAPSASGPTQIGRGAAINCVLGDFSQGAFETTNDPMDLAIGGKGFFQVRDRYSDQVWYTRAGNFRFNKDGRLTAPSGQILQGWRIDNSDGPSIATGATPVVTAKSAIQGTGVPVDIVLDSWTVPPKQTTKIQSTLNLTADLGNDKTQNLHNPFFALSMLWNGNDKTRPAGTPPLSGSAYAYQSSVKIYDEAGTSHTVTTYFDQVSSGQSRTLSVAMQITDLNAATATTSALGTTFPLFGSNGNEEITPGVYLDYPTAIGFTAIGINGVLTAAGLGTVTDLPIKQLPSGAWCFDLDASPLSAAQKTAILGDINTKRYCSFGSASAANWLDTTGSIANLPSGYKVYEYLVTMSPSEDMRTFGGIYNPTTGLLEDDPSTLTAATPISAGAVNITALLPTGLYPQIGTGIPYSGLPAPSAIDDVEAALASVSPPILLPNGKVGIVQWPSGEWMLDANDPYVAIALGNNPNYTPLAPLNAAWVTIDPLLPPGSIASSDQNTVKKFSETQAGGILMRGTLTFNAAGQLVNQTAYTYMGNTKPAIDTTVNNHPASLSNWEPTAISNNGYVVFTPNFTGHPMANSVHQTASNNKPQASNYLVEFDLGYKCIGDLNQPWGSNPVNAALADSNYMRLANMVEGKKEDSSTTSLSGSSVTRYNSQNGYAAGDLTNTSVDQDGIIYGVYSNGITMPLYQITLFDFVDPQGLRREGGNLFGATMKSGNPKIGPANQNGMGSVNSYSIEQSNVDMAREFVQMITTQRGFQANSKGVTTVDQMLETVIGMKR